MFRRFSIVMTVATGIALLSIDQWFKYTARTRPEEWAGAFWFLRSTMLLNSGIAFSIPLPMIIFWVCISIVVLIACARFFLSHRLWDWKIRTDTLCALAGIVAGGASNIIDRIRFNSVIDYWELPGGLIFNIADVSIVAGVIILMLPKRTNNTEHR